MIIRPLGVDENAKLLLSDSTVKLIVEISALLSFSSGKAPPIKLEKRLTIKRQIFSGSVESPFSEMSKLSTPEVDVVADLADAPS